MVGDLLGVLDGAAAFEVGGDAGGPEGVVADVFGQADGLGPAFDHPQGVVAVASAGRSACGARSMERKRGVFFCAGDACGVEIGIEVILGVVVGGHLVPLAAFLMQAEPCPPAFGVIILDLHAEGGTDAGEAEDHDGDQGPVA